MEEKPQSFLYNFETKQYEADPDLTRDEVAEQFIPQTRRQLYGLYRDMGKSILEAMVETLKYEPGQK